MFIIEAQLTKCLMDVGPLKKIAVPLTSREDIKLTDKHKQINAWLVFYRKSLLTCFR